MLFILSCFIFLRHTHLLQTLLVLIYCLASDHLVNSNHYTNIYIRWQILLCPFEWRTTSSFKATAGCRQTFTKCIFRYFLNHSLKYQHPLSLDYTWNQSTVHTATSLTKDCLNSYPEENICKCKIFQRPLSKSLYLRSIRFTTKMYLNSMTNTGISS